MGFKKVSKNGDKNQFHYKNSIPFHENGSNIGLKQQKEMTHMIYNLWRDAQSFSREVAHKIDKK
jgi:hypothetical protein